MIYKNKKIKIRIYDAIYKKNIEFYHPFFSGKIFYQDKSKVLVAVKGGILEIKTKNLFSEYKSFHSIKLEGKVFFNTPKNIEKSKLINKL